MDPQAADGQPVRLERVEVKPASRVRDALHIGIEIPTKFVVVGLLVAAFNAGIVWYQFGGLVRNVEKTLQGVEATRQDVERLKQDNLYQDRQLTDHETRLRSIEGRKANAP